MAAYYDGKNHYSHEVRWKNNDLQLRQIGFWADWQRDFIMDSYKYAIGLKGEKKPMGIYEGEEAAQAMVKLLLSNAKDGG